MSGLFRINYYSINVHVSFFNWWLNHGIRSNTSLYQAGLIKLSAGVHGRGGARTVEKRVHSPAADAASAREGQLQAGFDAGIEDVLILGAVHRHGLSTSADKGHLHRLTGARADLPGGRGTGYTRTLLTTPPHIIGIQR